VNEALIDRLMMAHGAPELPTLEQLLQRPAWMQQGLCRGMTAVFFSTAPSNLERARAICAGCPVREECLQYALGDAELEGVWAGLTAKERRAMRRGRVA